MSVDIALKDDTAELSKNRKCTYGLLYEISPDDLETDVPVRLWAPSMILAIQLLSEHSETNHAIVPDPLASFGSHLFLFCWQDCHTHP